MMSFSVVIWEIGIGAVVVTRVACFLGIVTPQMDIKCNTEVLPELKDIS